jgi:hypothetical protein
MRVSTPHYTMVSTSILPIASWMVSKLFFIDSWGGRSVAVVGGVSVKTATWGLWWSRASRTSAARDLRPPTLRRSKDRRLASSLLWAGGACGGGVIGGGHARCLLLVPSLGWMSQYCHPAQCHTSTDGSTFDHIHYTTYFSTNFPSDQFI